jgi:hypothetical protein
MWVESLADLGVIGLVLLVGLFAAGAWVAFKAALTMPGTAAALGLAAIGLCVWLCAAQGFVAGIPLDVVLWLGFGLAATGAAWAGERVRRRGS